MAIYLNEASREGGFITDEVSMISRAELRTLRSRVRPRPHEAMQHAAQRATRDHGGLLEMRLSNFVSRTIQRVQFAEGVAVRNFEGALSDLRTALHSQRADTA